MKVMMSGGGTAGHVFPALAVAERLREDGHDVVFAGSAAGQEASLVPRAGFPFTPLRVSSAQARLSPRAVRAVLRSLSAARTVRPLVRATSVVVGIGGYASAPALLAARRSHVPIVLIEQNAVPGVVNRIAARSALAVATTFGATEHRLPTGVRIVRAGNPVRRSIAQVESSRAARRAEGFALFELAADRPTVLVLGGSLGARQLDRTVSGAIAELGDRDLQLLVAAGPAHVGEIARPPGGVPLRVFGFIERMDLALAIADVAVARAGSGTIAELAACGIPSILVPYPHATENHQEANAREIEEAGGAEVALEAQLTSRTLVERLDGLLGDAARRQEMRDAMLRWARPEADREIADLVQACAA